mgnify:CR=1 FL=1
MIWINLPKYLIDFVKSQSELSDDAIRVNSDTFIGRIIYENLEKVPDGCTYSFEQTSNRYPLGIDLNTIGGRNEKRIYADRYCYYIPPQSQRSIETQLTDFFNHLFYNTLDLSCEYSEAQIKQLIEKFCNKYKIDEVDNYEMLKKRYFRYRTEKKES